MHHPFLPVYQFRSIIICTLFTFTYYTFGGVVLWTILQVVLWAIFSSVLGWGWDHPWRCVEDLMIPGLNLGIRHRQGSTLTPTYTVLLAPAAEYTFSVSVFQWCFQTMNSRATSSLNSIEIPDYFFFFYQVLW